MARGKDAPTNVGGQISPYVQQSLQQNKQLADNRLVTAMQQSGATTRTAMTEKGAGERASLQAGTQRSIAGAQLAAQDRRAAEDEVAKREDRKYDKTMVEASNKFKVKQAELEREFKIAQDEKNWDRTDELEKQRYTYRRFDSVTRLEAAKANINAITSMTKNLGNLELAREKAQTMAEEESVNYDNGEKVYTARKESVIKAAEFNSKMNLPFMEIVEGEVPSMWDVSRDIVTKGPVSVVKGHLARKKELKEGFADPMGALQDELMKNDGNISVELLAPNKKHLLIKQIQKGEIKSEDISASYGVLEGMLAVVDQKRKGVDRKTNKKEFDAWQNTYLDISQFKENLDNLVNETDAKLDGSETETVGSVAEGGIAPIHGRTIGAIASNYKKDISSATKSFLDAMSESRKTPSLRDIPEGADKFTIKLITDWNTDLATVYPELAEEGVE